MEEGEQSRKGRESWQRDLPSRVRLLEAGQECSSWASVHFERWKYSVAPRKAEGEEGKTDS